jgi:hypothetical protein
MKTTPKPGESSEIIALQALAFIAQSQDDLERFLNLSGLDTEDLRRRAGEPELLAAVLDFLLANEPLLTAFCASETIDSRHIHMARHALPGG